MSNISEHIKPRNTLGNSIPSNYGQQVQTIEEDEKYELNAANIHELQSLVRKYGWYVKKSCSIFSFPALAFAVGSLIMIYKSF